MKLSEYLYEKIYAESRKMFSDDGREVMECEPISSKKIEEWIEDYNEIK